MSPSSHSSWATDPAHRIRRVRLIADNIALRPLRLSDGRAWRQVRIENRDWLKKWEPTGHPDWAARHTRRRFWRLWRDSRHALHEDRMLSLVLTVDDTFAGQVNLGPIARGPARSADLGYWIDRRHAGKRISTTAVALVVRHAFNDLGLHRVHAAIRPDNAPSIALVHKLGFRHEAMYLNYLDINGEWSDHLGYALTADDDLSALDEALG